MNIIATYSIDSPNEITEITAHHKCTNETTAQNVLNELFKTIANINKPPDINCRLVRIVVDR